MFRITLMCEDSKLGKTLHALVGLAAEPPQVQPVSNAVAKNGQVRTRTTGTNLTELLKNTLLGNETRRVSVSELRMMVTNLGYRPNSLNSVLYRLHNREKFLRPIERGVYEVRH